MERSLFEELLENISEEGGFPEDYHLPQEYILEADRQFIPGAKDGIILYHTMQEGLTDSQKETWKKILTLVSEGKTEEAVTLLKESETEMNPVCAADDLRILLVENGDQWNLDKIFEFSANNLIFNSETVSFVKYGMILTSVFTELPDILKQAIRLLSRYDEFTFYALMHLSQWENSNEELFETARNVRGWGRIHSVERLEPDTETIREWLLDEGAENTVDPNYSALTVLQKTNSFIKTGQGLSQQETEAIGKLIEYLLSTGPYAYIEDIEDYEKFLENWLKEAGRAKMTLDLCKVIFDIRYFAEEKDLKSVKVISSLLIKNEKYQAVIQKAIPDPRSLEPAIVLGISFKPALMNALRNNFYAYFPYIRYLMDDPYYDKAVTETYLKMVPVTTFEQESSTKLLPPADRKEYSALDYYLREAEKKPLLGKEYVLTALCVPYVRIRKRALLVLENWQKLTKKPVPELLKEEVEILRQFAETEPVEELRNEMKQLLCS